MAAAAAAAGASEGAPGVLLSVGAPVAYAVSALTVSMTVLVLGWFVLFRCVLIRLPVVREIMGIGEDKKTAGATPAAAAARSKAAVAGAAASAAPGAHAKGS
mmetsp:Transcript_20469/g.72386  ORF Transcript_20469/g.72386 Transcript_20469/m.72386 type:complete len:102 (-) Transcript_20469:95-400(-)